MTTISDCDHTPIHIDSLLQSKQNADPSDSNIYRCTEINGDVITLNCIEQFSLREEIKINQESLWISQWMVRKATTGGQNG